MKKISIIIILFIQCLGVSAQDNSIKIHHAEPLYMDLIRDLGARRGEREWNIGTGVNDQESFVSYDGFVEYEFSPLNRLGLEIEVPFSFYQTHRNETTEDQTPRHRMEGVKTAAQYTFLVSEKFRLSMAAGYMNELKMHSFITMSDRHDVVKGNAYCPFLIIAKRWGTHFHSLIYTGPIWEHQFETGAVESVFQVNTSAHYIIPGTSHFVGIESNQIISSATFEMILRPQVKVKISDGLYIGLLTGIPVVTKDQRLSCMLRVIYEPKKKMNR